MKLIDKGVRPAVVKASRSTDKAYLEARWIDRLIQLDQGESGKQKRETRRQVRARGQDSFR